MKKIIYPDKAEWADMLRRPALHTETLRDTVKEVLDRVNRKEIEPSLNMKNGLTK